MTNNSKKKNKSPGRVIARQNFSEREETSSGNNNIHRSNSNRNSSGSGSDSGSDSSKIIADVIIGGFSRYWKVLPLLILILLFAPTLYKQSSSAIRVLSNKQSSIIRNLTNAPDNELKDVILGDDPHLFYCDEVTEKKKKDKKKKDNALEGLPSLFTHLNRLKGQDMGFAVLNCSQTLPSGKSIFERFELKREVKPIIFGNAPWLVKPQQLLPPHMKDLATMREYVEDTFLTPRSFEIQSDEDFRSVCAFEKHVVNDYHDNSHTCFVLVKGDKYTENISELEKRLMQHYYPKARFVAMNGKQLRLSFEDVEATPHDDFALRVHAVRNGSHFLSMDKPVTWDYLDNFVSQAVSAPLYNFHKHAEKGTVRLIKPAQLAKKAAKDLLTEEKEEEKSKKNELKEQKEEEQREKKEKKLKEEEQRRKKQKEQNKQKEKEQSEKKKKELKEKKKQNQRKKKEKEKQKQKEEEQRKKKEKEQKEKEQKKKEKEQKEKEQKEQKEEEQRKKKKELKEQKEQEQRKKKEKEQKEKEQKEKEQKELKGKKEEEQRKKKEKEQKEKEQKKKEKEQKEEEQKKKKKQQREAARQRRAAAAAAEKENKEQEKKNEDKEDNTDELDLDMEEKAERVTPEQTKNEQTATGKEKKRDLEAERQERQLQEQLRREEMERQAREQVFEARDDDDLPIDEEQDEEQIIEL